MRIHAALAAALLLFLQIAAGSTTCDISTWQAGIDTSCLTNQLSSAEELVLNASNCGQALESKVLRVYTPYGPMAGMLETAGEDFMQTNNFTVTVLSQWGSGVFNATVEKNRDILAYYDAFVIEAEALPELANLSLIAPLDSFILKEPDLSWFRISRYYRGFSALHGKQTYGIPLSGVGMATFYRKDLFTQLGLSVPVTWDDVLALARRWNGTDLDGDGQPEYGFCMSRVGICVQHVLLSMAAPLLQTHGPAAGFIIDSTTGALLLNSSGFVEAMSLWQQLAALGSPLEDGQCQNVHNDTFAQGRCLMTVQPVASFKGYAAANSSIREKLGVALPPGSARVLNRATGLVEPCTADLCRLGLRHTVAQVADPQADSTVNATVPVNDAPLMFGGLVGAINARNPWAIQAALVKYLAVVSATHGMRNVLTAKFVAPFRTDQWSPASETNWTAAGYDPTVSKDLRSMLKQLYSTSNLAPPLRLRGQFAIRDLIAEAATVNLTAGHSPAAVAAQLQAAVQHVLDSEYPPVPGAQPTYLDLYRQQIGYVQLGSPVGPTPPPKPRSSVVSRQTVVVISVVMGLVALLAGVVALEVRNKRRHKDLLGRVKPPMGDPDTTIVVASIQDFDELWEALISDASERALQQFIDLVDLLLRRHSGYRGASEEEDVVVAFHCPRDACEFALELQRGLLGLRWPRHVLEMEQFRPQYLSQTKCASFSQNCNAKPPLSPLGGAIPNDDEDKLFTLDTNAENVRSFGEQCVASWTPADTSTSDSELVFCGIRARVGVCAVGFSRLGLDLEPGHRRYAFSGEAVEVAAAAAAAAQGGMVLIPQSTFRQLHLELLAEQCLFCHLGEYQLTAELPPMDLYLALDRQLLGRLALFGPLSCHMQWSQGAFAAPVHSASMVFTHVVGVQTLLAWDYELMQDVIETFTKLAQVELQQAGGYLVEHVEGFMLTAFHSPADAILWGLRMQELMLKEDWPEELLAHELCEEVTVTVPVRGGEVTSATVFRGPRLKTGIDIGHVLARLHTMTGRMTYRGKVMNRAARISAAASSGQVLCSAEAWESCIASASALRLVTATSLGLFQLKGIQERIEVFHCTYQRHMAGSTRRSSTVSVGVVSSDNRRKSAVVLSSLSHTLSHQTTSYRTSMHNSIALDHVSASDGTMGRRGSATSSAQAVAAGTSMGAAQLSDMLHTVGADAAVVAASAAAGPSPARYRLGVGGMAVPMAAGDTAPGPVGGASGNGSHVSRGSGSTGGCGGGPTGLAARAVLAAVLQSRTRSASAIQPGCQVAPFRSHSARSRGPQASIGAKSAAASEPQVSLAAGAAVAAAAVAAAADAAGRGSGGGGSPSFQPWYTVTSPSATPSLAMAAAAAAAASCERSKASPKAAAALETPSARNGAGMGVGARGGVSTGGAVDMHSGDAGGSSEQHTGIAIGHIGNNGGLGGSSGFGHDTLNAAMYAVLPSVVLSNNYAVHTWHQQHQQREGGTSPVHSAAVNALPPAASVGGSAFAVAFSPMQAPTATTAGTVSNRSIGGGDFVTSPQREPPLAAAAETGAWPNKTALAPPPPPPPLAHPPSPPYTFLDQERANACRGDDAASFAADASAHTPLTTPSPVGQPQAQARGLSPVQVQGQALLHSYAGAGSKITPATGAQSFASSLSQLRQPNHAPHLGRLQAPPLPRAAASDHNSPSGLVHRHSGDGDEAGSRVETLEAALSATGTLRLGGFHGMGSSGAFAVGLLGSSQGISCISRSGSATAGMSCITMTLHGGLAAIPSGPHAASNSSVGAGGLGSGGEGGSGAAAAAAAATTYTAPAASLDSSVSSSVTHLSFAPTPFLSQQPLSGAAAASGGGVGRSSLTLSATPLPAQHAAAMVAAVGWFPGGPGIVGGGGLSGSTHSMDLFLPFPHGAAGIGGSGSGSSSATTATATGAAATASLLLLAQGSTTELAGSGAVILGQHRSVTGAGMTTSCHSTAPASAATSVRGMTEVAEAAETPLPPPPAMAQTARPGRSANAVAGSTVLSRRLTAVAAEAAAATFAVVAADTSAGGAAGVPEPELELEDGGGSEGASGAVSTGSGGGSGSGGTKDYGSVRCAPRGASGSSGTSSSGAPESRANSTPADGGAAAAVAVPVAGEMGRPCPDGGGLQANNRTGSGLSNDTASHTASPSYTWISGGSPGSTVNISVAGAASLLAAAAADSGGPAQVPFQSSNTSFRILLGGVSERDPDGLRSGGPDGVGLSKMDPECGSRPQSSSQEDEGSGGRTPAGAGVGASVRAEGRGGEGSGGGGGVAALSGGGSHRLRAVGLPLGSGGGADDAGSKTKHTGGGGSGSEGRDAATAAAMAAAFGVAPPPREHYAAASSSAADFAAAAAAFGVGPPVGQYGMGSGGGHIMGPTPEELERALELLGESRHAGAAGGRWH